MSYGTVTDTFESNELNEILTWWRRNHLLDYDNGHNTFYLYKNGKELDFDEVYELGFYEDYSEVIGPILEQEKKEKIAKCYICRELEQDGIFMYRNETDLTAISIKKGFNGRYRCFAIGRDVSSISCNFCPNCGRQLEEVN